VRIQRHAIAPDFLQPRFETTQKAMPTFIAGARRDPNNLTLLASNALDMAAAGSVLTPDAPMISELLLLASRAYAALFAIATAQGDRVEVPLEQGKNAVYETLVDGSLVHASRWIHAFLLASLCRDVSSLNLLCRTPVEMLRASVTRGPEYRYAFIEALIDFRYGLADTNKKILRAIKETDPERDDIVKPDWVLHLDVPLLEMLFYVNTQDADFAKSLEKAVTLHKKYWDKTPERRRSWDGFLAVNILGMAALARDQGLEFDVDSEYLPLSVLRALS
jgi:hypothetical protein